MQGIPVFLFAWQAATYAAPIVIPAMPIQESTCSTQSARYLLRWKNTPVSW
jgi:hypothetical protein